MGLHFSSCATHSITITSLNPASSPPPRPRSQHHSGTPGTGGLGLDYLAWTASGSFHTEPRAPPLGSSLVLKHRKCRISLGLYVLSALLTRMCCSEMLGLFLSFFSFSFLVLLAYIPHSTGFCPKQKSQFVYSYRKKKKNSVLKTLWHFLSVKSWYPTYFYFIRKYVLPLKMQPCLEKHILCWDLKNKSEGLACL